MHLNTRSGILFVLVLLLSACGGAASTLPQSDTDANVPTATITSFQTAEYYKSNALNLVNAADIYVQGGTGLGITIALMDSGINPNHTQLQGQVSSAGYDYVTNTAGVLVDETGHGTHIAGLMSAKKDNVEMHGLAYEATILPLRVLDGAGTTGSTTDVEMGAATLRALSQGSHIFNNSWGDSGTNILSSSITTTNVNSWHVDFLAKARVAIAQDSVYVWAAGNQSSTQATYHAGLPYLLADLKAGWLAVAAVDQSGVLASYSNQCGVAAAWCLAAPGGGNALATHGLYSTDVDGTYGYRAGTSMAAPQVSASLAVLKTQFPNLTYQQLAARVLTTANKTGVYADASIYGQGLLDLKAASSPVGSLSVPTARSASLNSLKPLMPLSKLQISANVAAALGPQLKQQPILLLDSYQQAPFFADVTEFVTVTSIKPQLWAGMNTPKTGPSGPTLKLGLKGIGQLQISGHLDGLGLADSAPQDHISLHIGQNNTGWHGSLAQHVSGLGGLAANPMWVDHGLAAMASPLDDWNQQWHVGYAWDNTTAFYRQIGRSSMNRFVAGAGAFGQGEAQQNQWGVNWNQQWGQVDRAKNLSISLAQSRLSTSSGPARLWQWQDPVILNQLSVAWQHRYQKMTFGVNAFATQAANKTSASFTWPSQIDEHGNIGFSKTNIGVDSLFNHHQSIAYVQWHVSPTHSIKLETKKVYNPHVLSLLGSRLVWQGSW